MPPLGGQAHYWGILNPLEETALCLHTCRHVSSSLSFFLSLPPCSQFCFVPKILILSFRKGAEVNKSTIKAFFLSRIDPLFFGWADSRCWFLSLTQFLLPWREGKNEEKGKQTILLSLLTSFWVLIDWVTIPRRERHLLSGWWGSQIKRMVCTQVGTSQSALSPT